MDMQQMLEEYAVRSVRQQWAFARDHGEWVIEGEKWYSSNARFASFLIVMAVTDPDAAPHARATQIIVPADTPGVDGSA